MRAQIILNQGLFQEPKVYEFPIDKYFNGSDYDAKSEEILRIIFRQCNHVDGTEWVSNEGRKFQSRSLSAGDLVRLDYFPAQPDHSVELWVCQMFDWKQI